MPFGSSGGGGGTIPTDNLFLTAADATSVDPLLKLKENPANEFDLFSAQAGDGTPIVLIDDPGSGQVLSVGNAVAGDIPIIATAALAQSADIFLIVSNNGTPYGGYTKNGFWYTAKKSAPADAELAASQAALWLDDTPGVGNTRLMIKAKDSGGTVRTGAIVLA